MAVDRRRRLPALADGPHDEALATAHVAGDEELVAAAIGRHHQYPDGFVLYLGTMFAPVKDRGEIGQGFTHNVGDMVTISSEKLGALVNRVQLSPDCAPWTDGASHLMRDRARAGMI